MALCWFTLQRGSSRWMEGSSSCGKSLRENLGFYQNSCKKLIFCTLQSRGLLTVFSLLGVYCDPLIISTQKITFKNQVLTSKLADKNTRDASKKPYEGEPNDPA